MIDLHYAKHCRTEVHMGRLAGSSFAATAFGSAVYTESSLCTGVREALQEQINSIKALKNLILNH